MKKGEITWDLLAKLLIGFIVLIIVVLLIYFGREDLEKLLEKLTQIIRFGG